MNTNRFFTALLIAFLLGLFVVSATGLLGFLSSYHFSSNLFTGNMVRTSCGDGLCDQPYENGRNCPTDCRKNLVGLSIGSVDPVCGNNLCEAGEATRCPDCVNANPPCKIACQTGTCPQDCPVTKPTCGNGRCEPEEKKCNTVCQPCANPPPGVPTDCSCTEVCDTSCPQDCPINSTMVCPLTITERLCSSDQTRIPGGVDANGCPRPSACCGDGTCESYAENTENCPKDCGIPVKYVCNSRQIIGDLNGDGKISIGDRVLLVNIVSGFSPTPSDVCCADLTRDGSITIGDQVKIDRILSGLENSPGICAKSVVCGNGICDAGENNQNCPKDCVAGSSNFRNADWTCYDGKKFSRGNGDACHSSEKWRKQAEETCKDHCSKEKKCGVNTFSVSTPCSSNLCGNGKCEGKEDAHTCPQDCPKPKSVCGNKKCEVGENEKNCPADCIVTPPKSVCGNKKCEVGENEKNCSVDCPLALCGNGICEINENCPQDCITKNPICGNGVCEPTENAQTCAKDCCTQVEIPTCAPTEHLASFTTPKGCTLYHCRPNVGLPSD